MKNSIFFFLLLLIYNPIYSQSNNPENLLFYGRIVKTTDTTITLGNLKVLSGIYDKENITIKLRIGIVIGVSAASISPPTNDWIDKFVLIETRYVKYYKSYYTSGKYGSWGFSQPALTPDGHTLYFLTQENNIKNGITGTNADIISAIQNVKKANNIKDEIEKLKEMDKIISDSNEYIFIREYCIWEMNKVNSNNVCTEVKKSEIIASYIGNKKTPLYIRLKARDFNPDYPDYSKYYQLLHDLKNTINPDYKKEKLVYKNLYGYRQSIDSYKEYYIKEVVKKNKEDKSIIELINQNIKK